MDLLGIHVLYLMVVIVLGWEGSRRVYDTALARGGEDDLIKDTISELKR